MTASSAAVFTLGAMSLPVKWPARGDRLVGAQSLGILILVLAWFGFAIYVVADLAKGSTPIGSRLSSAAGAGAISGFMLAAGSARTFVRGDTVHVVSFFVTYLIPVAEIIDVSADNGMTIQVTSGRAIGSMAFGTSLIAEFTGNRRGKRAARRLAEIIEPFADDSSNWTQDTVEPHPRWAVLRVTIVITGLAMLLAVL